jgi:hypothetical protein
MPKKAGKTSFFCTAAYLNYDPELISLSRANEITHDIQADGTPTSYGRPEKLTPFCGSW